MKTENVKQAFERNVPSWAVSLGVHGLILVVLAMIPIVATRVLMPDRVLTLEPVVAGEDPEGVDDAGDGATTDSSPSRPAKAAQDVLSPPAVNVPALEQSVADLALPTVADTAAGGGSDLSRNLRQMLAKAGDTGEPSGGAGDGGDLLSGTSGKFGEYIGQLRGTGLDIVLVLDATDSMTPYIGQAKQRLHEIVDVVTGLVPSARFGVVAYKDYGDEYGPNAVKFTPIAEGGEAARTFINDIVAGGGGDIPEPINEALSVAVDTKKMGWLVGRKHVIILVGDSPIHPSGRKEAFALAARFVKDARGKGSINVIDVGGTGNQGAARDAVQPDLQQIARDGEGSAFLLKDSRVFWQYLIVSVFGERYKNDVDVIIKKFVQERGE